MNSITGQITLNRNAPCPCGSGRKYKKCCWHKDKEKAASRAAIEQVRTERLREMGHPTESDMRGLYEEMTGRNAPPGPIAPDARQMITELWQQRRLIAKSRLDLEQQKPQWEAYFAEHEDEFDAIARELATHPFFLRYELTKENVKKVRQDLGELPSDKELLKEYANKAVSITLDSDDRSSFNEGILSLLPDLMYENKMKEAYVADICANRALDTSVPITPFFERMIERSMRVRRKRRPSKKRRG